MFVKNKEVKVCECAIGVTRKILGEGGTLMMVEVKFDKGVKGAIHKHIHEQVSYVSLGSFEVNINDEIKILTVGDSFYVGENISHGVTALENNSVIIDVFTPKREDFK